MNRCLWRNDWDQKENLVLAFKAHQCMYDMIPNYWFTRGRSGRCERPIHNIWRQHQTCPLPSRETQTSQILPNDNPETKATAKKWQLVCLVPVPRLIRWCLDPSPSICGTPGSECWTRRGPSTLGCVGACKKSDDNDTLKSLENFEYAVTRWS